MAKVRKKYLVKHVEKGVLGHYEICYVAYSEHNVLRRFVCYRLDGTLIGYETAKRYIAGRFVQDMYVSVIREDIKKVVV